MSAHKLSVSGSAGQTHAVKPRAIHQLVPTLVAGDAVGNHVLAVQRLLRSWGYASDIFADNWLPSVAGQVRPYQDYERVSHPQNLLLLHYSTGGPVNRFALNVPDRLVLYYHNITPAHFFYRFNAELALLLEEARRDLALFAGRAPAIAASDYNARELAELGFEVLGVVTYAFALGERRAEPDGPAAAAVRARYGRAGSTDWLHVGRLAPNKCLHDIIQAFACYHRWINANSRLLLVGGGAGLGHYADWLHRLVTQLRLDGQVVFTGHTQDPAPYYGLAQVYVAMSEHEGFCIPLVEAMQHDLPVVAYAAAAVPDTLGPAGVLIRRKDFPVIAEMVHETITNAALRARLLAGQRARLAAFAPEQAAADLRACLARLGEV